MERTLILCKPDCMQKNLAGEVIGRIQKAGLRIQAAKVLRLTDALLAEHYSHLTDKPFFPEIVQFMKSAPVLGLIMTGDNAVATVRKQGWATAPQEGRLGLNTLAAPIFDKRRRAGVVRSPCQWT